MRSKKSLLGSFGLGKEKEYFIEQLSMLLGAGMPVTLALSSMRREIKSVRLKKSLLQLRPILTRG